MPFCFWFPGEDRRSPVAEAGERVGILPFGLVPPRTSSLGITGLNSFLDASFGCPTRLQRTINSKEDCYFYIGALLYQARGPVRAELVSKEGELFYRINLLGSSLISCGRIVSEK